MYNKPTVPNRIMLLSLNIKLKPLGPISAPAIIKPIRWGIFNLLRISGANSIINRINEKINTGFFKGRVRSNALNNIIGRKF